MEHKEYNGYWNYETWHTALLIDNEQGSYNYWTGQAEQAADAYTLAEQLKEEHEAAMYDSEGFALLPAFASQLMLAGFSEINWTEIAENLIEEAKANGTYRGAAAETAS